MDTGRAPLRRLATAALAAVPTAFLALFFAYPLGSILVRGLGEGGIALPDDTAAVVWFTA